MNRAERRRQQKSEENDPVLSIKRSEINKIIQESYKKGQNDYKNEGIRTVFIMLLGLPCMVLHEKYGFGNRKRLPEFADAVLTKYEELDKQTNSIREIQDLIYQQTGVRFYD